MAPRVAEQKPAAPRLDWGHTAIPITFDSVEDATLAKTLCLESIPVMRLDLDALERDGG